MRASRSHREVLKPHPDKHAVRVGFIADRVYPFYTGGYEYLIYNLATRLSHNWDVSVYTSMDDNEMELNGATFKRISKRYRYTNSTGNHNIYDAIRFLINLRKSAEIFDSNDIVMMNSIPYLGYGNFLHRINATKISLFHEAWFDYLKEMNFFSRSIIRHEILKIVRQSDSLIANSSATRNSLLNNYNAKKVNIIPTGIDASGIDCVPREKKFDIIYLGRLARIKHVDHIIKAAGILVHDLPDIRIAIVGEGEDRQRLEAMVRDLNMSKNVLLYGRVNDKDKYELLKSSRLFVLPSEREGFSVSTLEAMCCGAVPIVAEPKYSEVFGTSDFVKNGFTGLYYAHANILDLRDKIMSLMNDSILYDSLRKNAIDTAKQYDWSIIISNYESVMN